MTQSRQVPGLALVVVKDGRIVREQGYGSSDGPGKQARYRFLFDKET